jgi:transposase-like protein
VCKHIGISHQTLYLWKKQMIHEKTLEPRGRSGRPRTLSPALTQEVAALLRQDPTMSNERIAAHLGVGIHPSTISRYTMRLGITRKKISDDEVLLTDERVIEVPCLLREDQDRPAQLEDGGLEVHSHGVRPRPHDLPEAGINHGLRPVSLCKTLATSQRPEGARLRVAAKFTVYNQNLPRILRYYRKIRPTVKSPCPNIFMNSIFFSILYYYYY